MTSRPLLAAILLLPAVAWGQALASAFAANDIPVNKRYAEFTSQEKAALASLYEGMPTGVEPPFPADGMEPLLDRIRRGMPRGGVEGPVQIAVTISPAGKPISVKLIRYPDLQTAKFVANVLVTADYKPAVCSGTPCQMDFPFDVVLRSR
jgi:hypothetical protein